jgi:Family of unknown function (DUF5330)
MLRSTQPICHQSFTSPQYHSATKYPQQQGTPEGDAMGILRTLLVLGAGLALLPSPPPGPTGEPVTNGPGSFAYLAAAAETVADMRGFCQRNPNACATAAVVAGMVEGKAKYSAKLVYEWANEGKTTQTADNIPRPVLKKTRVIPKG